MIVFRRAIMPLVFMLVTAPANAQTVMGAGMLSCGEWLKLRSIENNPGTSARDLASLYQLQAWVDGFLSGVNIGNAPWAGGDGARLDFLNSHPTGAALYAVVDNYCKSNPLDAIILGAEVLVKELQRRSR